MAYNSFSILFVVCLPLLFLGIKKRDKIIDLGVISQTQSSKSGTHLSGLFASELMLDVQFFVQTGPPPRVNCEAPSAVCHMKMEVAQ